LGSLSISVQLLLYCSMVAPSRDVVAPMRNPAVNCGWLSDAERYDTPAPISVRGVQRLTIVGVSARFALTTTSGPMKKGPAVTGGFKLRRKHSRSTSSCPGTELFTDRNRPVLNSVASASSGIRRSSRIRRGQKDGRHCRWPVRKALPWQFAFSAPVVSQVDEDPNAAGLSGSRGGSSTGGRCARRDGAIQTPSGADGGNA
jgi:hypothetical protein